jgi:hypothetical protein
VKKALSGFEVAELEYKEGLTSAHQVFGDGNNLALLLKRARIEQP